MPDDGGEGIAVLMCDPFARACQRASPTDGDTQSVLACAEMEVGLRTI